MAKQNCWQCDFYQLVVKEQGRDLARTGQVLAKIKQEKTKDGIDQ